MSEVGNILTARERQRKKLFSLLQYPLTFRNVRNGDLWINFVCFSRIEGLARREANFAADSHDYVRSNIPFTVIFISAVFQWLRWHQMNKEQRLIKICTMPIIGKCYCYYFQYYLTSILGSMLQQGLSLAEICEITQSFDRKSILYFW